MTKQEFETLLCEEAPNIKRAATKRKFKRKLKFTVNQIRERARKNLNDEKG